MDSLCPLRALSDDQIEQYRIAAEDILETTGFCVQHPGLLRSAQRAGARIDEASGRVRLPAPLLRERVAQAPSTFAIRKIAGDEFVVGGGSPGIFAITNDPWILDYRSQMMCRPRIEDVRRHTALAQQIEGVVCMSCMDFPVVEYDDETSSLRALETHLLNHAKHYAVLPASLEKFHLWLELGRILNRGADLHGSRLITCGVAVLSPLTLTPLNGGLLTESCAYDFPVLPTVCPMAGTTAPYTAASTLLLAHCENLFMAAMTQIVRPGNPFLYALGPSVTDLRTGANRYYPIDKVLWKAAGVQLAKAYGLPCTAECGGTMNGRYDMQSGAESVLFMVAARGARADLLAGLGSCHNANGLSAEMMVIQETWLRVAEHLYNGIDTAGGRFGIENIKQAGPGANFLTDELTLEFAHGGAFFDHPLLDCAGGYGEGVPLLQRAHERVDALLSDFRSPVPQDLQESLRRLFHDRYR